MLQLSNGSPAAEPMPLSNACVRSRPRSGTRVSGRARPDLTSCWVRGGDAFARLTALGGASYGLAFRAARAKRRSRSAGGGTWDPVLLIDELIDVVEHALVGALLCPRL